MKKTILITAIFSIFIWLVNTIPVQAQPGPPSYQQKAQAREQMKTVRAIRLVQYLNLDTETGLKATEILNKYDDKRIEVDKQFYQLENDLQQALQKDPVDEVELKGLIKKFTTLKSERQKICVDELEELEKVLTVEQQAKYIVFQKDFRYHIRQIMRQSRGMGGGMGRGMGPGGGAGMGPGWGPPPTEPAPSGQ